MANSELEKYIAAAKEKGAPTDTIKSALLKAGWGEIEINEALNPEKSVDSALPPPPAPHFGMWVSFQYILLFICLYISATALGIVIHHAVNKYLPDNLDNVGYYSYYSSDDWYLNGAVAAIVVSFPVFAFLFISLKRLSLVKPGVKNLRLRKILVYLTLIGTFVLMIGHLITTVYGFLEGSTTTRSLAHLAVNLVIAGSIFGYLLIDVREDRKAG